MRAAAQDQPSVDLDSVASGGPVSIEVIEEADGAYLRPETLRDLLRGADPNALVEWDGAAGELRIISGGAHLSARLGDPRVLINGQPREGALPLRMKSSGVIVPVRTAKLMLAAIGLQLDLDEGTRAAPVGDSIQSGDALMRMPGEESAAPAPSESVARANMSALPALNPPPGAAGETGLTWAMLADAQHASPPRRLVITCDKGLDGMAGVVRDTVARITGMDVEILQIAARRNDPRVLSQVVASYPDLLLDLMVSPTASPEGTSGRAGGGAGLEIWTVHGALWPGDSADGAAARLPYRTHQFHNLALASLIRGELGAAFPGRSVVFNLAPAYLLRRVNAPAAAVLVSAGVLRDEIAAEAAARAVGRAVSDYARGMASVTGAR